MEVYISVTGEYDGSKGAIAAMRAVATFVAALAICYFFTIKCVVYKLNTRIKISLDCVSGVWDTVCLGNGIRIVLADNKLLVLLIRQRLRSTYVNN